MIKGLYYIVSYALGNAIFFLGGVQTGVRFFGGRYGA